MESISWTSDCDNIFVGDLYVMLQTPLELELQYSFDETALTKTPTEGTLYQYKDKQFALALSRLLNVASIEHVTERERSKQDSLGKTTCKQCGSVKAQPGPFSSPSSSPSTSGNVRRRVNKTGSDGCPTTPKGRKAQMAKTLYSPSSSHTNGSAENGRVQAVNPIFAIPTALPLKSKSSTKVTKSNGDGDSRTSAQELQYAEALAYKEKLDSLKSSQEVIHATRQMKIRNRPSGNRKPIVVQRMLTSRPNVVASSSTNVVGISQGNYLSFSLMPVTSTIDASRNSTAVTSVLPENGVALDSNMLTGDILQNALTAAAIPQSEMEGENASHLPTKTASILTTYQSTATVTDSIQYVTAGNNIQYVTADAEDGHVTSEPNDPAAEEDTQPNLSALLNDVSLPEPDSMQNTSFSDMIEGKSQTSFSEALMLPKPTRQSSPKKFSAELEFLPKTPTKGNGKERDQFLETPMKSTSLETPTKSTIETPRKLFETPFKNSEQILSWFGSSDDLTVTDSNLPNMIMTEDSNPPQTRSNRATTSNGRPEASTSTSTYIQLPSFLNESSRDSIISNSSVDFSLQSLLNENSMDYVNKFADLASHISGNNNQNLETPKKGK